MKLNELPSRQSVYRSSRLRQAIQLMLSELDQIHSINQVLEGDQSIIHLTEVSDRAREIFGELKLPKPVNLQQISV